MTRRTWPDQESGEACDSKFIVSSKLQLSHRLQRSRANENAGFLDCAHRQIQTVLLGSNMLQFDLSNWTMRASIFVPYHHICSGQNVLDNFILWLEDARSS
ncbi:unnamed protein product [Albugo candida]|uniref:Uncharacterized protein n=1 Tax=Albugo candida TaxID=65357 RepID=A0A024FTV7_9STRA|nr:unnamed protein product [Albugo candida]|eukprot:CCI10094.1 unnamed protein product [Albugo candida]